MVAASIGRAPLAVWVALVEQTQNQKRALMRRTSNAEETIQMYYDQLPAQPRIDEMLRVAREERLPFLAPITPGGVHDIAISPAGPPQFDWKARPMSHCEFSPFAIAAAAECKLVIAPSLQCAGFGVYPGKDFKEGEVILKSTPGMDDGHWVEWSETLRPLARPRASLALLFCQHFKSAKRAMTLRGDLSGMSGLPLNSPPTRPRRTTPPWSCAMSSTRRSSYGR